LFATSYREKIGTFLFVALIAGAAVHYSTFSIASTFLLVNLFYLCALLFKLLLVSVGRHNHPKRYATDQLDERSLPLYTILIPLYREERTLPKLLASIRALDYPKHKLDVKLIVEADDPETFAALKALKPERYFDIIRVPASEPRTKPKACNYAMRFAKGEYVTIYDAEDEPEPGQLKQAVLAFRHGDERLVCVQARLNYHNRFTKFLPGCFALEYSLWFDFMLPGLAAMGMPIPLGGTSNHFKMEALKELEYWDPFNVTEDADLGVRLLWKGYRVGLIDSITWEESPVRLYAWIRQRSRWIKGYMQTYFVHMRKPLGLCKQLGIPGFFGFQMFIGAPTLMYLINPLMIAVSLLIAFFGTEPFSPLPNWLIVFAVINLLGGILLQISFGLISALHHRWWRLILHACLSPLYFLLHSAASLKALAQLITRPHYWEKTEHGVG
jgi:cellulose synthase/poly-beta-1,6-N-acetylglucosamine synthase-like glycosyltransferase